MPNDGKLYDVFLSHAHVDADVVTSLAVRLEDDEKLNVWLDKWNLIPGNKWQQEMAKGIEQAKSCAVCIGSQTPKGWFRDEIEKSLNRQNSDDTFRVIPVILPGGDQSLIDDFLELRTWVIFSDILQDKDPFHRLVCGIKGVSPGRSPDSKITDPITIDFINTRERLKRIRDLRKDELIDDDIALEYQRILLDDLFRNGQ